MTNREPRRATLVYTHDDPLMSTLAKANSFQPQGPPNDNESSVTRSVHSALPPLCNYQASVQH